MYFDYDEDDDDNYAMMNPEIPNILRVVLQKMNYLAEGTDDDENDPNSRSTPVPTHTEDGIPIRKLYVSNLPPKTNRAQLFEVFAQYGFIKSCWVRMGEKGTPTYAFVTFSDPADAHKALQAPYFEKTIGRRYLRTMPADSWHQPLEDAEGKVIWKPKMPTRSEADSSVPGCSTAGECSTSTLVENTCPENDEPTVKNKEVQEVAQYDIMDVLNRDCIHHILSYVPLKDLIRAEAVNKRWAAMIQEYFFGIHTFKTSWWEHDRSSLTTAVLRQVLQRLGAALQRLHIDHHVSALNDRTAHIVGKYCPDLEELKIVGMHTQNWNPIVYGCKNLRNVTFISCNKLADANLVQLLKEDSNVERLTVADNSRVTGLCLSKARAPRLRALAFHNCFSLQGTVLAAAAPALAALQALRLDVGSNSLWKAVPSILQQLPQLEELSLSEYMSSEERYAPAHEPEPLRAAFAALTNLQVLNLSRNIYVTDELLQTVAASCPRLLELDVACCNHKRGARLEGVGDEGVAAVCRGCPLLRRLDISYLGSLTDAGAAQAAHCRALRRLAARGMPNISARPLAKCLESCHELEELDVCGCDAVGAALAGAAARAVRARPRALAVLLAGTAAALDDALLADDELPPLLTLDAADDRSNPNLRPDFVDTVYELGDTDDDELDEYGPYFEDHADFDSDDDDYEVMLNSDENDYEVEWGFNGHDIMLL